MKEIIILAIILMALPSINNVCEIKETIIYINNDGSAIIEEILHCSKLLEDVSVTTLGKPIYVKVSSEDECIPFNITDNTISFIVIYEYVNITYITLDLTAKVNETWILKYSSPHSTIVVLPNDTIPITIEPTNVDIVLVGKRIGMKFPPGNVLVKYIILPKSIVTSIRTFKYKVTSKVEGKEFNGLILTLTIALPIASIVGVTFYLFLTRRSGALRGRLPIDEVDKKILEVLNKYGELSLKEIQHKTGLPKTTLYRRLRKLVNLGLVEVRTIQGLSQYRIKVKV